MSEKPPKFVVQKDEHYRDIIVNGVYGGRRPGYFEAILYTDELSGDEALRSVPPDTGKIVIRRTIQCRLVIDPVQAKSIARWLSNHVAEYEKEFGKIPFPEEIERKFDEKKGLVI